VARIPKWALNMDKQEFVKWFETGVSLTDSFALSDMNTFVGYVSQSYLDEPSRPNPTVENAELRFDLEIPDLTEKEVIAIRSALRNLDREEIALKTPGPHL
jgi:hypothetical protein